MFGTRLRHLPVPLIASVLLLLIGATIAGVVAGKTAALGMATGIGIVTASYTISVLVIAWADSIAPKLILPFGMGIYVVKYTWIGMIMMVLATHHWPGMSALGFGVIAGVICWTAAQIWTVVRSSPKAISETPLSSDAPQE